MKKKEWILERNVFEEQLENLNLQLVNALTENQELKSNGLISTSTGHVHISSPGLLSCYSAMLEEKKKGGESQSLRREVDRLKKEKKELQEKMEKEKKAHRKAASSPGVR